MDHYETTVWTVIRRFILGWLAAGILLVIVSCVKHKDFIITTFTENTWGWINGVMPLLIIIFGIGYAIRSVFR